jgi:hypothetical protein
MAKDPQVTGDMSWGPGHFALDFSLKCPTVWQETPFLDNRQSTMATLRHPGAQPPPPG